LELYYFLFAVGKYRNVRRSDDHYHTLHIVISIIRRSCAPAYEGVYFLGENVHAIKTDP